MGLDMYLTCNSRPLTDEIFARRVRWGYESPESFHRNVGVVCYWRKANAVHRWFVDNVQGGVDDCGEYVVTVEQLTELRDVCRLVLESSRLVVGTVSAGREWRDGIWRDLTRPGRVVEDATVAARELPTQDGFFFGCTDYDEGYVRDLRETLQTLDAILDAIEPFELIGGIEEWQYKDDPGWAVEFRYRSSW